MTDKHAEFGLRFRPALADDWQLMVDAVGDLPIIVSANQVARARTALAARLVRHAGFRVDPVNYRLDPSLRWVTGTNGIKSSYATLDREYAAGLGLSLLGPSPQWSRMPTDAVSSYVHNVLRFQHTYLLRETREAMRLFTPQELHDVDRGLRPAAVLCPYEPIEDSISLANQVALWQAAPPQFEGVAVEGVLCVTPSALRSPSLLSQIVDAAADIRPLVLWIWFVRDRSATTEIAIADRLRSERRTTKALAARHDVRVLHAGFFEMALTYDGATEAAFGLGMNSSGLQSGGGGLELGLFYSEAAHRNIWYAEARDILSRCRTLGDLARELCRCEMCAEAFSQSPASLSQIFLTGTPLVRNGAIVPGQELATSACAALNRFHKIFVRATEAANIRTLSRQQLAAELTATAMSFSTFDSHLLQRLGHVLTPESA